MGKRFFSAEIPSGAEKRNTSERTRGRGKWEKEAELKFTEGESDGKEEEEVKLVGELRTGDWRRKLESGRGGEGCKRLRGIRRGWAGA